MSDKITETYGSHVVFCPPTGMTVYMATRDNESTSWFLFRTGGGKQELIEFGALMTSFPNLDAVRAAVRVDIEMRRRAQSLPTFTCQCGEVHARVPSAAHIRCACGTVYKWPAEATEDVDPLDLRP